MELVNNKTYNISDRGKDWFKFSKEVHNHIETYTVPQYGDKGNDLVSTWTAEACIEQAKKYLSRFGKSKRQGEDYLDLIKAAHYIQMAATKMGE